MDTRSLVQAQDGILDELSAGLDRQKAHGEQMNKELRRQDVSCRLLPPGACSRWKTPWHSQPVIQKQLVLHDLSGLDGEKSDGRR